MIAFALFTSVVLAGLGSAAESPAAVASADVGSGNPMVIMVGGDDAPVVTELQTGGDGQPRIIAVRRNGAAAGSAEQQAKAAAELARVRVEANAFPKYWIGVRLSDVPAPLAAHIGAKGAMILNVMKGSPADSAGIEQYDIVTSVNGAAIDGPGDLTEALRDKKAGDEVTLSIVRKAADRPIRVTLAERPVDASPEPKFEEPESEEMTFGFGPMQFRGRALQLGPDGKWGIHDLGQLDDLDEMLEELKVHVFDPNDATWQGMGNIFQVDPDDIEHNVAINIVIDRDGEKTEIKTDAEGKITVNRTAADGAVTSSTYDNFEVLGEKDPAAAELYSKHVRLQGPRAFVWHGSSGGLGKEFRVEVRRKVEQAMREAEEQMADAQNQANEAMERLREKVAEIRVESRSGDGATSSSESFVVNQSSNGVSVRVIKNGNVTEQYNFDSIESLKQNQPEIYERVKKFLD